MSILILPDPNVEHDEKINIAVRAEKALGYPDSFQDPDPDPNPHAIQSFDVDPDSA